MSTHDLLGLIIVTLGAWRAWRVISTDTILDWPRDRILGTITLAGGVTHYKRKHLADFVGCAWCLGFWLALGAAAAWHWWSKDNTVLISIPLAASAAIGLITNLD